MGHELYRHAMMRNDKSKLRSLPPRDDAILTFFTGSYKPGMWDLSDANQKSQVVNTKSHVSNKSKKGDGTHALGYQTSILAFAAALNSIIKLIHDLDPSMRRTTLKVTQCCIISKIQIL